MTTKTPHPAAKAHTAARPAKSIATGTTKPTPPAKVRVQTGKPTEPTRATKRAVKPQGPRSGAASPPAAPAQSQNKQARIIALLRSPNGGTIEQMTALTGWQAHTVRGAISGVLRRRLGLSVTCAAAVGDGARIYRIVDGVGA
jgi:hypothetical protein